MPHQFRPERAQNLALEAAYHRVSYVLARQSGPCYFIAAHALLTIGETEAGLEYGIQQGHIKRRFMKVSGESVAVYSKKEPTLLDALMTSLRGLRERVRHSEN